jgi:hypothetical protein
VDAFGCSICIIFFTNVIPFNFVQLLLYYRKMNNHNMKLNFNEICRLCLLKEGDMSSIFAVPLPKWIMSFVSFEVSIKEIAMCSFWYTGSFYADEYLLEECRSWYIYKLRILFLGALNVHVFFCVLNNFLER